MATPVHFNESNIVLEAPGDSGPLPALISETNILSCWELTQEEIDYVVEHGRVWLTVWGLHPPVNITAADPFALDAEAPVGR